MNVAFNHSDVDSPLPAGEIFIVDDDATVRNALTAAFSRAGFKVLFFAEGAGLLAAARDRNPICIVLDVNIPGRSGLDILKELKARNYPAPIMVMSGQGSIGMAVDAMKSGARDFIEKPFRGSDIVGRVRDMLCREPAPAERRPAAAQLNLHFPGRQPLTPREQAVLRRIVDGETSKVIARELAISPRTVDVHRARIITKLGAQHRGPDPHRRQRLHGALDVLAPSPGAERPAAT